MRTRPILKESRIEVISSIIFEKKIIIKRLVQVPTYRRVTVKFVHKRVYTKRFMI